MKGKELAHEVLRTIIARTRSSDLTWETSDDITYYVQIDDVSVQLNTGGGCAEASARRGKQVVFQFTHRNKDDRAALAKLRRAVTSASEAQTAALRGMLSHMAIPTEDPSAPTTAACDDAGSDGAATTETDSDDAPPGGEAQ